MANCFNKRAKDANVSSLLLLLVFFFSFQQSSSLQLPKEISSLTQNLSRRDVILLGGGSILYGKVLSDAISRIGSGFYPLEHEQRVSSTFKRAIVESSKNLYSQPNSDVVNTDTSRPFRILEIGIGEDYRTVLTGSYNTALESFFSKYPNQVVSLIGLDYLDITAESQNSKSKGKKLEQAKTYIQEQEYIRDSKSSESREKVTFDVMQGDICASLPSIPDGYFDVVTCCLLLCSVIDQEKAVQEIKRILRPNGGAFGYLEHVAVEGEDFEGKSLLGMKPSLLDLKLLEKEQVFFDPAQQLLAHNCHLHRNTENIIWDQFHLKNGEATIIEKERFYVDQMWPVSCQTRGIIVKS